MMARNSVKGPRCRHGTEEGTSTISDTFDPSKRRDAATKTAEVNPDCDLPENSDENLDTKLNGALEETFPTSDPISVKITN